MHSLSGIRNTRVLSRFHRIDELALARRVDGGIGMFSRKSPNSHVPENVGKTN